MVSTYISWKSKTFSAFVDSVIKVKSRGLYYLYKEGTFEEHIYSAIVEKVGECLN